MKSIFLAAGMMLAATAVPGMANAQDTIAAPEIVVTGKYERDWNKGSELEAKGLNQLEKAKKDLIRYSADVVNAQNKRDTARARSENASAEFRKLTSSVSYFSDASEASRWARQVEKAASDWAKNDDRRGDGRKDLDRAMKKQANAQKAVDQAQAKVDKGRAMKAEAERLSSLDSRR